MRVIKQLQIKFILSLLFVDMIVFAAILLSLNFVITRRETRESRHFLEILSENDGHRPRLEINFKGMTDENGLPLSPEVARGFENEFDATTAATKKHSDFFFHAPPALLGIEREKESELRNYFAVKISPSGTIRELILDFPINYTDDEIANLVEQIFDAQKRFGSIGGIMYNVSTVDSGNKLICFLNRNAELKTLYKLYIYSISLYILCILISLLLAIPVTSIILRPTKEAFLKQKQFIADAGHELKTPIAVISANIDVLESEIKDNKWLQYIKAENQRMGDLVKDLLYLAKNDAGRNVMNFTDFDFSNAIENSILPFEVVAFESGKKLTLEIQDGIICNGDEKQLKQIFIILVDNAIKNSENSARITVRAFADDRKIVFKVHNTGSGIPKEELEKIFLRFYRSDSSRARKTGGYGLGLAIARAIAKDHGGTLTAASELGKWAEFTLTLPKRK